MACFGFINYNLKKLIWTQKKKRLKLTPKRFTGAEINKADNDKVSESLVKERVETENNNPRNND